MGQTSQPHGIPPANVEVFQSRAMKKTQLNEFPAEQLIEKTRALSAKRMRAIYEGKPKEGNRMFDLLVAIHRELRARGIEAQRQLLVLLDDADLGTRCWVSVRPMTCREAWPG